MVEIILAIGVITFALVGILGLFPVALDNAAKSQQETQAALIARTLFDQLRATPDSTNRNIYLAEKITDTSPAPISIDISKSANPAATIGFDSSGKATPTAGDPLVAYKADISVSPITSPDFGLSNVVVTVKIVSSKFATYSFTSILKQKQ